MTTDTNFKDHFSIQAEDYSLYRPEYPTELYDWLASLCPERALAWDCATGTGQVAVALTNRFGYVIGTDASESQIYHATTYPRVEYEVALAHQSPLQDNSVDLITVGQALHWFEFDLFFKEVERVAKADAVLAVWCYELHQISAAVDAVVKKYYHDIIGDCWPPERHHIEQRYATIDFPFETIKAPKCTMEKQWTFKHLVGYLGTWSATQKYIQINGEDPRSLILDELKQAWGNDETKAVTWPVTIKTFRIKPTEGQS
ncbi:class I SAM-dependent methyltransferase [Marinicella sp. S1101]|uniref:class I SAM-dependent methyltransferase n=1 Tax=Marinicella marina TaxID=2996016 RepID=UPI002260861C|nr:class I SAM-dependent methyltransferase [Marinicella marina]MCX7553048.1 class I SAM-dependent methyltransferase [Marinicella marina]MDJ1139592.1 class I SAM-dependent methyltransferase [Marinicella marina]